jgi:hypothetical protein
MHPAYPSNSYFCPPLPGRRAGVLRQPCVVGLEACAGFTLLDAQATDARKLFGQQAKAAIGAAVLNPMLDAGRADLVRIT